MPPNGLDEWRARIGHWENRKLRWFQAHCGSRPRVPLHLHLERVISEAPLLCVLLLLSLAEKVGTPGVCEAGNGVLSSLGKLARCRSCGRREKVGAMPLLALFLALSLLLVLAGDVETNPGPISDELLAQVDDSELTEVDTRDVYREVIGLAGRWSGMCLALGLLPSDRSTIEAAHRGNPHDCLQAVVVKWLQKGYDYQRYGPPTWRMLVESVGHSGGGENNALAEAIAKKHPKKPAGKHTRVLEGTTVETAELEEVMTSDDEEWDPPAEFAGMLTTVTELLDHSANLKQLKRFLKFLCHPRTQKCYINTGLYEHCNTPGEIIEVLHPQYINFMHTHLLRRIVNRFGDEQSKMLLKQYEDKFPRKKPLKRLGDPFSDEEIESFTGTKRMKVVYNGANVDTSTVEDVERVRLPITRNTGIDESVIPFASQKQCNSVTFMFLIPETAVSAFSDLGEDNRRDLADHDILRIEVNELVIDLASFLADTSQAVTKIDTSQAVTKIDTSQTVSKTDTSQAEAKTDTSQAEAKTDTSQAEAQTDTAQAEAMTDAFNTEAVTDTFQLDTTTDKSQEDTKSGISTYTSSGMKRVPLTHDSLKAAHCNSKFQQLLSEVGTSLAESVEASKLKDFLQSFSHILYPETQYIDPTFLKDTKSVPQMFTALQPQILNFLNWGVLWKAIDAFHIKGMPTFQSYTDRFPPHTQLSTLPDPLSEEEISGFKGLQKLRVTHGGGSRIEWTLSDVQAVREAIEKATGIDGDFIIYAYWEEGFTTHQFTFLIPESISGIFWELCEEDLAILAGRGVQRLEVDYDTVADNVQELYQACPQTLATVTEDNRMRTKSFGLEQFIPEDEMEQMSKEEFIHLNTLITSIPAGKLQETCSNDFLKVFAKKMGSWKDLAPYLGINQWDLEDLAEMYPRDEEEQKYVALLNWKSIDVSSATYKRLVECLLTHGHIDDAKELLLHFQDIEVQKAQNFLRQRFLKDSFPKRKLWFGAPELPKFDRKFGIIQSAPLLSELDYTSCYEMMDQFPSEIQELSMKSMLNKIAHRKGRVFIFKGPPGCGKTELMSRICRYWAKQYALRKFSLVMYVNIWDLHPGCSLQDLIDRQFKGSTVSSKKICHWIEEEKGNEILFILDGFCQKYLHRPPLREGEILSNILFGKSSFFKSTVVISTTCSDFVKPLCDNFTQFDILGLSDEQIGKQVIQHFDSERAFNFLTYLAANPEIKGLVLSPGYLLGIMYVFGHISYDDLPVTWTELYTSLIVLVSEWHKGELSEDFASHSLLTKSKNRLLKGDRKDSLQSQLKESLLENSRRVIKDSGDLIVTIGKLLIHSVEKSDYELPDHNSTVPYLEYFLFSLEILLNHKKLDKTLMNANAFSYFWYFVAGLGGVESNSKKLLKQYYGRNCLKMTNRFSEARYFTAKQQTNLSSLAAEVSQTVVTTHDIHSILHCLPYMKDPRTVVLEKCLLGTHAVSEFSRFLAADSWSSGYAGIMYLCLRTNGLTDTGTRALARALQHNKSLEELNLEENKIGVSGASALADALRVNKSLKVLNLRHNNLTGTRAIVLAGALQHNNSLEELNLQENKIGKSGATALADALRGNKSLKVLNLRANGLTATGAIVLAGALQHNKSLEELNLDWTNYQWTRIGDEGATALADVRVIKNFKTLNLRHNGLTDTGTIALAKALQNNKSLEELNLEENKIGDSGVTALADALRVNKSLTTLNLRANGLTATGAIVLARALQQNKSLEELNLDSTKYEWTRIGDGGAIALADARVIDNFKTLKLYQNGLTDTGAIALARALQHNKSLEELNLEENKIGDSGASALADALRVNKSLKVLNLRANDLTATGAIILAGALQQNKSLEELNLNWTNYQWTGIGDAGATALADVRVIKNFKTLNLRHNGLTSIGAIVLTRALQQNKSLEELNLEENIIGDSGASALADTLRVNKSLKVLNLRANGLTATGAIVLARALQQNKSLEELNLDWTNYQWTGIGDEGATALADIRVIKNLKTLNLRHNGLTAIGAIALARALQHNKSLKELNLERNGIGESGANALADALRVNKSLKVLNLRFNDLTATGAIVLTGALQQNKSLEELNLEENKIGESGASALADALRVNKSLKVLNVRANGLTATGAIVLTGALQQNKSLKELNLEENVIGDSGASALADALRVNQSLKVLNLRANGLTATGAIVLTGALQQNKSLEELNLDWTNYQWTGIGDEGSTALADVRVIKNFKTLNLRYNGLTAIGAITLARALQHNKSLKELNLEGNEIGDSGASALADALRVNKSLKVLNLRANGLTATGAIVLAGALQQNKSLKELNLDWTNYQWTGIGDEGATALADVRVIKNFKTLNLRHNGLTAIGAIALARALQNNKSLKELNLEENRIGESGASALADSLRVNKSLKVLNLRANDLTATGAIILAGALQQNKSLEELNLDWTNYQWTGIGDAGATTLADVRVIKNFKTLNLRHNGLTSIGAIVLTGALQQNKSLEELNLEENIIGDSGASALADALRVNQSLKVLNLRSNDLTATGAIVLAGALQQNKSLEELNLDWTNYQWTGIGDEGATALADIRVIKNLKTLNLGNNGLTAIGAVALARGLQHNKSLKELNLEGNEIGDSGATALVDALRVNQSLKVLNLRSNDLTATGAIILAGALQQNKSLEELNLEENEIGESGATALADALKVNKSLEVLNLEENEIGESGAIALADALRVNKSLKVLNLRSNGLTATEAIILAGALQQNKSLEELNLDWTNYQSTGIGDEGATALADVRVIKNFKTLNLRHNGLTATGALALARALQHNKLLKGLSLEGNDIGDSGAPALADALRVNQSLTILNLRNNGLTAIGAIALARALQHNKSLKELNLEENKIGESGASALADTLRVNKSLKVLSLRANCLTATGAIVLARALQQNKSLEELNLDWTNYQWTRIGDEGATALADVRVMKNFKTLNLRHNGLTATGAIVLARALQHNKSLEELNLEWNKIGDSGASALADALRVNQSLTTMDLKSNDIAAVGTIALARALQNNKSLKELNLEWNEIGDSEASTLADALRVNMGLKVLNLRANGLTATGAIALAEALQHNKSLEELNLEENNVKDSGATALADALRVNQSLKTLKLGVQFGISQSTRQQLIASERVTVAFI